MPLTNIILILVVASAAVWAIDIYIPMGKPAKTIVNVVLRGVVLPWSLRLMAVLAACFRTG